MTDFNPLALENQLCFPLYAASKEITRRYKPFLDPLGLTYTQYVAMMVLWEHDGITVGELGSKLYLDSATLTPLLKRLEAHGFVRRERSHEDERAVIVTLTDEGRALRERALEVPYCMAGCLEISPEDATELKMLLEKLLRSIA
ncbi:MAG: MarR family transcriptional regulator [Atopobiaceae bacterium]|nr:MarR family transcriptional regulator [Atopobiaceae bacterium]